MQAIAKWIRHNQGVTVGLVVSLGLLAWTIGCESKVTSLIEPAKKVSAGELDIELRSETARLEAELDQLMKRAELRVEELNRQNEIKRKLFEFAALTAQAGTVNPSGVITLVGSVLGMGLLVDNRIKDKVIKNRPLSPVTRDPRDERRETS